MENVNTLMDNEEAMIHLLRDIRASLAYHQSSSIDTYPANEELSSFCDACKRQESVTPHIVPKKSRQQGHSQPSTGLKQPDPSGLKVVAADLEQCSNCSMSKHRKYVVLGSGGEKKIRVFFVGHWLTVSEGLTKKAVFGAQEDSMLGRMLAAIGLSPEEVFVANVIKCGIGLGVKPQAEHLNACVTYLYRQIEAASPEVICSMGMVATKALLRLSQPLSQLRGRFHPYKGIQGREVPVLPTYHPSYLLQNPEMKNATWQDLQLLEKRLQH